MATEEEATNAAITQAAQVHPLHLYFNAFINQIGPGDFSTILIRDNQVVGVVHMSATTAKTFAKILTEGVEKLEELGNQKFPLAQDVLSKMIESQSSGTPKVDAEKRT